MRLQRPGAWLLLAPLLTSPGCKEAVPPPRPHYVVGPAYQLGGVWRYPVEDFQLDTTGLAAVLPARTGLTADGEAYDGTALAAAHPTLQLPAYALVTNLENGRQAKLRVNDRGPDNPARVIGVTRGAADALGIERVARVRVRVLGDASQALRDELGARLVTIAAAPTALVTSETLAPSAGTGQSSSNGASAATIDRVRKVKQALDSYRTAELSEMTAPARNGGSTAIRPGTATGITALTTERYEAQVAPNPGQLWIRAGEFSLRLYADQVAARLGVPVMVEAAQQGRSTIFRVRAGPYPDVAAADSALDRAVRTGVTDAHVVVE